MSLMVALRECSKRPHHSKDADTVLGKALQAFQPKHVSNHQLYGRLMDKVVLLKSRLQPGES